MTCPEQQPLSVPTFGWQRQVVGCPTGACGAVCLLLPFRQNPAGACVRHGVLDVRSCCRDHGLCIEHGGV